jgi:hypothetical protein
MFFLIILMQNNFSMEQSLNNLLNFGYNAGNTLFKFFKGAGEETFNQIQKNAPEFIQQSMEVGKKIITVSTGIIQKGIEETQKDNDVFYSLVEIEMIKPNEKIIKYYLGANDFQFQHIIKNKTKKIILEKDDQIVAEENDFKKKINLLLREHQDKIFFIKKKNEKKTIYPIVWSDTLKQFIIKEESNNKKENQQSLYCEITLSIMKILFHKLHENLSKYININKNEQYDIEKNVILRQIDLNENLLDDSFSDIGDELDVLQII